MIGLRSACLLIVLGGCADSLVGGECRPGFEARGGRCEAAAFDPDGGVWTPGEGDAAIGGGDAALADGALPDGADNPRPDAGGLGEDAGTTGGADAGAADGGGADGGEPPLCDVGELACGARCVRPGTDREHCGGCGAACATAEICAGGSCVGGCEAPRTMCGGLCVDLSSDADHCGSCGNRCASGICEDGACATAMAGHLVIAGHDYQVGRRGMNRIAGNAVFLAPGAPVRVVAYEGDAIPPVIRGVDRAIDQVAGDTGRSWSKTVASASHVSLLLAEADALLIYPQRDTSDAALRKLGEQWSLALTTFLYRGGVVILFDGAGSNEGTWQITDEAGLFAATGRVEVSGDVCRVVSPADAVAVSVPLGYRGETSTIRFVTSDPSVVVAHDDGPVVIHRIFAR